jgi:uncharacterized protein (TIGR00369 family)
MSGLPHFERLENMSLSAPINEIFCPTIDVGDGVADIEIELSDRYHHAAGGAHGSVYFKMLDDAAFFAASSLERKVFMLTTTFTTYLTRPVSEGKLRATAKVVSRNRTQIIAEAVVYDARDREIGRGNGLFVRSKSLLSGIPGYRLTADTSIQGSEL